MAKPRRCKDCPAGSTRPAPNPGPRCQTHHKAALRARRSANHEARVVRTYGLLPGDYERLYAGQGGRCAICQRATGASRRLAVDHDHATGQVRGLLCSSCNFGVIGRLDMAGLARAYHYLADPPAVRLLAP